MDPPAPVPFGSAHDRETIPHAVPITRAALPTLDALPAPEAAAPPPAPSQAAPTAPPAKPARPKGEPARANPHRETRFDLGARTAVPELHTGRRPGLVLAGGHRMLRPIGRSVLGPTWAGRGPERQEIIRVLDAARRGTELRASSRRAIEAAARLPGFVRVLDVGDAGGVPFVVTERVAGQSLARRLENGPLAPALVASIVADAARAIDALHAASAVHGALRTSSLLVDGRGRVHVDDLADVEREEASGFGDAPYRSPEQLGGRAATPADDVWALAVVAYEALTGSLPFVAPTPGELIARAAASAFDPPTFVRPELPRELNAAFLRAFADEPEQRFASAGELAGALASAIGAPPRFGRRARWIAAAALGVAACVALVAALGGPGHAPHARSWVGAECSAAAVAARRAVVRSESSR